MSYSFAVTAGSKAEAKQKIVASFAGVIITQPSHAADLVAAVASSSAFVDLLEEPDEFTEIYVSMSGSLGWRQAGAGGPLQFTGAGVNVSASLRPKDS